jgi:hypothetical protein
MRPLAMVVVVVAGLLAAASPAAAATPITFHHTTGSRCVAGAKPATGTITVRLIAPNGTVRATRTSPSVSAGLDGYEVCFPVTPRPGDRFRGIRGSVQRTVKVPTLTIGVNRVTDVVTGRGPSGRQLTMEAQHCDVTDECDAAVTRNVTVNRHGRYQRDLSSSVDLRGMDPASVSFGTSAGDVFSAAGRAAYFQAGTPDRVAAYCASPGTRHVILRRADGRERARASFQSPHRCISDKLASLAKRFRRNGNAVSPATGNVIRSDIASDARMVWPGPAFGIGNGSMTGKCLPNAPYGVYLRRPSEAGIFHTLAEGTTSADGLFQRAYGMTLEPGDRIRMLCVTPAGDHLVLDLTYAFT